jgi:hypothetical protein
MIEVNVVRENEFVKLKLGDKNVTVKLERYHKMEHPNTSFLRMRCIKESKEELNNLKTRFYNFGFIMFQEIDDSIVDNTKELAEKYSLFGEPIKTWKECCDLLQKRNALYSITPSEMHRMLSALCSEQEATDEQKKLYENMKGIEEPICKVKTNMLEEVKEAKSLLEKYTFKFNDDLLWRPTDKEMKSNLSAIYYEIQRYTTIVTLLSKELEKEKNSIADFLENKGKVSEGK